MIRTEEGGMSIGQWLYFTTFVVLLIIPTGCTSGDYPPSGPIRPDRDELRKSSLHRELEGFRFKGAPIHPALVEELDAPLADPLPTVVSVDLEAGHASNRTRSSVLSEVRGFLRRVDSASGDGGGNSEFFEYRYLGCTKGGLHVLETAACGGGSGVFMAILLVTFEADDSYEQGNRRTRVLMKRVGEFRLGDRDDGTVTLSGNRLRISASRYRPIDTVLVLP
jgi:hypothetical protein